jgi:putative ABC transport system permease protein
MFGTENAVGMTIDLSYGSSGRGTTFRIIGIRDDNSSQMADLFMGSGGYDIKAECPFTSFIDAIGLSGYIEGYGSIVILLDDAENASAVLDHTRAILEARHDVRGENALYVLDYNSIFSVVDSSLTMVTLLIMLVAAISLFVGGIGVMNIMLVSVTERTSEIGIRKALGARTGSIMTQFLAEAAMITFVGGIIGVLLGYGGAEALCFLVSKIAKMSVHISINIFVALGAAIFSAAVGLFFGIFPAKKAATLSPIEALRQE